MKPVVVSLGLALSLSACGVDVGAPGAWVPIEDVEPPFATESNLAMAPSTFRSLHPVATDRIRVVSFNIDLEVPGVSPSAVADAIANDPNLASAGVFLMQDCESYPGEAASRVRPIAEQLGLDYLYVPARIKDGDPTHTHGLAILTAFPITNVLRKELPLSQAGAQRKIAVSADLEIGDRVLHIIDVHLELGLDTGKRLAQLRPAVIDAPQATLVAGDFNMSWVQWAPGGVPVLSGTGATDQSETVISYMKALGFDAPTEGSGPTAHAFGIEARVDAIFSRGLDVTFGGVPRIGPSDHWPVWVDVALR